MSNEIQVLTTLEYLGPYPRGSSNYYFGVVLQTGVPIGEDDHPAFPVTRNQAPLLQPWLWTKPEVNIWAVNDDGSIGAQLKVDSSPATKNNPTLHPGALYTLDKSIIDRIGGDFEDAFTDQDFGWSDPQHAKQGAAKRKDNRTQYPWPAHLAQLSRYPFPIPHLLNLAFIVKIDPSTRPVPNGTYVAALKFSAKVAGTDTTFTPQNPKPPDTQGRVCVPYDPDGLVSCTVPLKITSLNPPEPVLTSVSPEVTDWQAHLVAGCADLFDLAARLIDPVRKDCNDNCAPLQGAVAASFSAYIAAVLTAERDIVAYGCQLGPDGSCLLQRLCDRWVSEGKAEYAKRCPFAKDFLTKVKDQLAQDRASADQASVQDKWLLLLKKNASLATSSLIGAPPDALAGLIYDSKVTYQKGNTVLYQTRMFVAGKDGTLSTPSSASTDWSQLTQDISIFSENLSDRLMALEHLRLQFTQSDLLSSLLLAEWDQFAKDNSGRVDAALFQSFRDSAASALADLNIRDLLLQGNLQDSWGQIIANVSRDLKTSRTNLRTDIPKELSRRLSSLLNAIPGVSGVPGFRQLLVAAAKASAEARMDTLVPQQLGTPSPSGQGTVSPQATRSSEGISVLLDGLSAAADPAKDVSDNLRQMSGLCALMREKTEGVWRCLDVAYPMTTPASTPPKPPVPAVTGLTSPIVVPVPQHNQDALRRAILTYNNQPLMSEGPAHGFSKGLVPAPSNAQDRLISFEHPSVRKFLEADHLTQWKIPGLAFARSYDLLIGRVSNSGALPPSFADRNLGPAILSFDAVKASNLAPSVSAVPYRRTVPIGVLRFGSSENPTSVDKIDFPAAPADVHPRATEVYPNPNGASTRDKQACPLIMLTPYKVKAAVDRFTLRIRKPTTDLLTWDRWKAALDKPGDSAIRQERTNIWSRFHVLARQESTQNNVALDDPAVLSLSVSVSFEGKDVPVNNAMKSWQASNKPLPNTVLQNASDPLTLTFVTSVTAATLTVDSSDSAAWVVTLPPGGVAKVTLTTVIDPVHVDFFAPGIVLDSQNHPTLQPYTFLVESANQTLPSVPEILSAFKIAPPATPAANTVDFILMPPNKTSANYNSAWQHVRGADLQTQVWRWDGRPSPRFPFGDVVQRDLPRQGTTPRLLEWELETFSTRRASDATIRPMTPFQTKKDMPAYFGARDDRGTELGATYYRAAVTVYNRYGSLVPENPPLSSKLPPTRSLSTLNEFASIPGTDGGWTRRFIPARLTANASVPKDYTPPKPAIKFIVPLTGSTDDSQAHAASVLVVVQGPWYAIAGLAEDIRAHITESEELEENGKKLPRLKEAGPDPISFEGARSTLPTDYDDYGSIYPDIDLTSSRFHGPIGHTFDSSDVNPLWVTSSFVLDPPRPKSKVGDLPENSFARVQFQRVILKDGLVVVDKDGNLSQATDDFKSEPTDPVWIQFLPSRFVSFNAHVENLTLHTGGGKASIKHGDDIITLSHALNVESHISSDSPHVIFGLLLTEEVTDLLGRKGQERFHDILLQPSADKSTVASWKSDIDSPNLVGRIIAIQRQVNVSPPQGKVDACQEGVVSPGDDRPPCTLSTADELWRELFVPDGQDVIARIVAVSPPISRTLSISCGVSGGNK